MQEPSVRSIIQSKGYRDTLPRHIVIEALEKLKQPVSPYDIQQWIDKKYESISPVTVYRVIELLESLSIVHKHPCNGKFALCTISKVEGLHSFLHCNDYDRVQEFCCKGLSERPRKKWPSTASNAPSRCWK